MALYIYCPRKSDGAYELVKALEGVRLRRFDGMDFWDRTKRLELSENDVIICWGGNLPEIEGLRILNSVPKHLNKFEEVSLLAASGVPSVALLRNEDIGDYQNGIRYGYLPRTNNHEGGADLLFPKPKNADFWTRKEAFTNEYRVHSFDGRSIRAGVKVVRDGFTLVTKDKEWKPNANLAHPWVRSFDGGWRIKYDGFQSNDKLRNIAHKAIKSLGLTFGAVDIGEVSGGYKIIEVNRAPGIEGGTLTAYVNAIKRWIGKEKQE